MTTVVYDHQTFCMQRFGGISRYFCELAERVSTHYRVRVVAPMHFNDYLAQSRVATVGVHVPLEVTGPGRPRSAVNRLLAAPLQRAAGADIVHRTYYVPYRAPGRARVVVTVFDMIHELLPENFAADDATSAFKRASVAAADHVMCISHSTARDLQRLFGTDPSKITVAHLGFSSAFSTDGAAAAWRERPYLLYVGQRAGYKNFATALDAYLSSPSLRDAFDLVAYGAGAFDADELSRIESARLRPGAVRHVRGGSDAELAAAYRSAHAFIYPSRYEGFGIPPLEAMSCGCPVVSSNTSSLPEVVGDAAELCDPASTESIRAALERVAFDSARRTELIDRGAVRASTFTWERCAEITGSVYERLA